MEPGDVNTTFSAATSSAEDHLSNNTAGAKIDVAGSTTRRRAARH
jgi:hypothetical protein